MTAAVSHSMRKLTLNTPGKVVSAILDRRKPLLVGREVQFDVPDTLPLFHVDASLLEQSLGNLLDNVAMHNQRTLTSGSQVALRQMEVCAWRSPTRVRGFQRKRASAFSAIRTSSEWCARSRPGLALARAAVEAQGGQLWVEHSATGGARFVLRMPAV